MSWEDYQRALSWGANVEGADKTIDASGGNDGRAVLVPIVGQGFGWGVLVGRARLKGGVERDGHR